MKNRHGIITTKRELYFMSFKGDAKCSTLDQVTLPPECGVATRSNLRHRFGEWLKRGGKGWEFASDRKIAEWCVEYWNDTLEPGEKPRRFDRLAKRADLPGGEPIRAPRRASNAQADLAPASGAQVQRIDGCGPSAGER